MDSDKQVQLNPDVSATNDEYMLIRKNDPFMVATLPTDFARLAI